MKLNNKLIGKEAVSALKYSPAEGSVIADTPIHLRGDSQIKLTCAEAVKV